MSSGEKETYRVIVLGFYEAFHGIQANYQMKVQKLGMPKATQAVQNITYNINGNNAWINQSSVDNSTNFIQINTAALQNLESLRKEISQLQVSEEDRIAAIEVVETVEEQLKSGYPKNQ